jgi:hypothetical protein
MTLSEIAATSRWLAVRVGEWERQGSRIQA